VGWGVRFREWLTQRVKFPGYVLEDVLVDDFPGRRLRLSSFPLPGYRDWISRQISEVNSGTLRMPDLQTSFGSLTIGCVRDPRDLVLKGQVVQLRIGDLAWDVDAFEPVFTGCVQNVRRVQDGVWAIDIVDLAGQIQSRFTTDANELLLFNTIDAGTTVDAAFTANTDTTLTVVSTTNWSKAGDGDYAMYCTPTGGGDPFYLVATGLTATTFTGVSTADRFATTQSDLAVGDSVIEVAWQSDHPITVAERLLLGTDYPDGWSWKLPADLVASDDMAFWIGQTDPGSSEVWDVLTLERLADGRSWLEGVLQPAGMFLTQWQGRITARAVRGAGQMAIASPGFIQITDDLISEIELIEAFDPSLPVEYRRLRVQDAATDGFDAAAEVLEDLHHRPAEDRRTINVAHIYSPDAGPWVTEVTTRLSSWWLRLPERVVLRLAGWEAAVAAPGDSVQVVSGYVESRASNPDLSVRRGMVASCSPDWFGATTRIEILYPPLLSTDP
jgi:hypothetical protein